MAAAAIKGIQRESPGFTLIEVLVAIAIVAILAATAYPIYTEQVRKVRRAEIASVLVEEAQKLERFYSRAGQYSDTQGPPVRKHEVSVGNAFYVIDAQRSQQTFVLVATPIGGTVMSGDTCGGFTLENTGRRDNVELSGDASVSGCWGR